MRKTISMIFVISVMAFHSLAQASSVTCDYVSDANLKGDKDLFSNDRLKFRKVPLPTVHTPPDDVFSTKTFQLDGPQCLDKKTGKNTVVCQTMMLCTHTVKTVGNIRTLDKDKGFNSALVKSQNLDPESKDADPIFPVSADPAGSKTHPGRDLPVYEQVACAQVNGKCPEPTDCYAHPLKSAYAGNQEAFNPKRRTSAAGDAK